MNESTKTSLVAGVTALVVALVVGMFLQFARPVVSPAVQPSVVVQPIAMQPATSQLESKLGGLVHNTQESFDAGFALNGVQVLGADGSLTISGTSTLMGSIVGIPDATVIAMTANSSTACAVQNTSGLTRTLVAVNVLETTYAGAGTVGLTVGTSTTAFATSTNPLINNSVFANSATSDQVNTTSTLQTAYGPWRNTEWLVFKTVTSTNAGSCRVLYY